MFEELSMVNGIAVRGRQIVVPVSLRADAIALAHEGHQCADKTINLLRQTCWFPKMSSMVRTFVSSCSGCNASATNTTPVPLEPNLLPEGPWQKLHADFKGPIGGSYYLHIVIDQFSKYAEVDIVKSTSFKKLRPILERIFSTHGIPESVSSDNGPPYPSDEMERYAIEKGFQLLPVTPCDPQSNGFAESFVKFMCKMVHTCIADGKSPKVELHNYLLQYRATPHSTTGVSPAELLFGRKIQTKLPQIKVREDSEMVKDVRKKHDERKMQQKHYFDKRHRAHEKVITQGDQVLVKQKKSTTKTPYDPSPYTVTSIDGNRLHLIREDGSKRIRDKNQIRLVIERPADLIPSWTTENYSVSDYMSFEIEGDFNFNENHYSTGPESNSTEYPANGRDDEPEHEIERHSGNESHEEYPQESITDGPQPMLYDIDEDEEARMNALLLRAHDNQQGADEADGKRLTRSSGLRLEWNSAMNEGDVVIERKDN